MSALSDITRRVFGKLTVLHRATNDNAGRARWECSCACKRAVTVRGKDLRSGHTTSCGCSQVLARNEAPPAPVPGALWVPLGHARFALVDSDAPAEVFSKKWKLLPNGYAVTRGPVRDTSVYMHVLVARATNTQVDHISHDRLDNRRINLRLATAQENNRNRSKSPGTSSVYKGVNRDKWTGRWKAGIKLNRKYIHLGRFDTEQEAAAAYDTAAKKLFGAFAHTNEEV